MSSFSDFFGRERSRLISFDGREPLLEVRSELWLAGFEAADFGSDSELLDVEDDVVEVSEDLIIESALALEEGLLLALDLTDAGLLSSIELLEVL